MFTCFDRLPIEIRFKIWRASLADHNPSRMIHCYLQTTPIPAILQTSHEARTEEFRIINRHSIQALSLAHPPMIVFYSNTAVGMLTLMIPINLTHVNDIFHPFISHCIDHKVCHIGVRSDQWTRIIHFENWVVAQNGSSELERPLLTDALESITVIYPGSCRYLSMVIKSDERKLGESKWRKCIECGFAVYEANLGRKWGGKLLCREIQKLEAGDAAYEHVV